MNATASFGLRRPPPPHLTMDEYVVWIQTTIQQADPVKAARQKAIQEHITAPFRIGRYDERPSVPQGQKRDFPRTVVGAHTARHAFRWGVTAAFAAFVARLCLMPGKQLPQVRVLNFPQADKLVHFCLFGLLAGLICWAADERCRHRKAALFALVAVSAYGSLIEVLQPLLLSNDRCFSLGDIAANTLGAAFFAGSFLALRQWTDRRICPSLPARP